MSGGNLKEAKCGGCTKVNMYGMSPTHESFCAYKGKHWDILCICGHWGGIHASGHSGCQLYGCNCVVPYTNIGVNMGAIYVGSTPKVTYISSAAKKCECGANKCGHGDLTPMHSAWCPVFAKDKPKEEDIVSKVRAQKKGYKWNPYDP